MKDTHEMEMITLSRRKVTNYAVAGGAAVAIAVGAFLLGSSASDDATPAAAATPAGFGQMPPGTAGSPQMGVPPSGAMPQGGPPQGGIPQGSLPQGPMPQGGAPQLPSSVSGATKKKVERAVLADRDGKIERVDALPDGSYVAHLVTDDGEVYVTVSKDFKVTGTAASPFGGKVPPGAPAAGSGPRS